MKNCIIFSILFLSLILPSSVRAAADSDIFTAIEKGNIETVKDLLENDPGLVDIRKDSYTPLHWAIAYNKTGIAELLLTEGADVNAKNNKGDTPLKGAEANNQKEMIDLLLKYGAQ